MLRYLRHAVVLVGLVAALAVTSHDGIRAITAMHDEVPHDAVVACILLFTGIAIVVLPTAGAGRYTVTAPLGIPPATVVRPRASHTFGRASPPWLQRFLR